MRVTSPMGWAALAALGVGILVAAIWSFVGEITTKVDGQGILVRGEAVLDVTAAAEGRLLSVDVGVGDIVKSGRLVAKIEQPELESNCATSCASWRRCGVRTRPSSATSRRSTPAGANRSRSCTRKPRCCSA